VCARALALLKVRVVVCIDLVFHFGGNDGQALNLYPLPRFFALVFFEHWQIGVMPPAIRIAHNCYGLDQNSFFRHDCSFAAIAADFEGGGSYSGALLVYYMSHIAVKGRSA
jgi:hypothetical protein